MGNWYRVVKTIKGRRYAYQQRTWREGKRVRTENRYLGPVGEGDADVPSGSTPPDRPSDVTPTGSASAISAAVDEVFSILTAPLAEPGEPTHCWSRGRKGEDLVERVGAADNIVAKLTDNITSQPEGAYYEPNTDTINIPSSSYFFNTDKETATQAYYAMLFHELGHWTGHPSRLNRLSPFDSLILERYASEELVAEATAIILLRHLKLAPENLARHASYFQDWLAFAGDREEALAYARDEAERAARFILSVTTT